MEWGVSSYHAVEPLLVWGLPDVLYGSRYDSTVWESRFFI
jgi:hypothetical protein